MTKLVCAISNHASMLGGGEHSFLDFISNLPSNWKHITIVPKTGELSNRFKEKGITVQIISLPPIRPWLITNIISCFVKYFKLIREHRPVVVYANGSRAAFYGGIVGKILKLPVIWHCRIAESDFYLDHVLGKLCSRIIVNSKATANRFKPGVRHKIRMIYNGIDIGWLKNTTGSKPSIIKDEWKVILVVARVSKWKQHDLVLSAFETVAESDPDAHLICIGAKDLSEPKWWDHLQRITKKSLFSNRIHWLGHVKDVRPWYQIASLSVLMSNNEPFGRVLVESMAYGVPIVAIRSGGVPEIVRHGVDGLLVNPSNTEEISDLITKILKNNNLKRRFAKSCQKRAQLFSLDKHIVKMIKIFEETVALHS